MEGRSVATCDIPGAFMQVDIDEQIHMRLDGELAELLVKADPTNKQFIAYKHNKPVIYTELDKALYGTLQADLLFWQKLRSFLIDTLGFQVNPYDHCVVNKDIDGSQCTIGWHVDHIKISHKNQQVVNKILEAMNAEYGKETPLTITHGAVHEYLGMKIDFSQAGEVKFSMPQYIDGLVEEIPADLSSGVATTPAANRLFQVNPEAVKLSEAQAEHYHHLVAKLLYLCKRTRPDLQTAVAFLTTRVQGPDVDDWKKLGRCLRYLCATQKLPLILCCDPAGAIQLWIDASFAVHPDMQSHTGATMSLGKGAVYSFSTKQRINTRSSTEAELVGVNDAMSLVLWTRHFLEAQGFSVKDNVIFQDNESTMLLARNGRLSSTKNTRHIDIRYYFITDHIKKGRVRVAHCPTTHMIADCLTKALQGAKFREFRNHLLNISEPMQDGAGQECVETPWERPALGSAMVQQVAPGPDRSDNVIMTSTPGPNVRPVLASVHELVVPVTRPHGEHADCLTKALQGAKFREFRNHLLNISEPMQDGAGQECVETPWERPALGSATVQQVAPGPDRSVNVITTSTPGPNVRPVLASVHELVVPVTRTRGEHAPARSRYRMAQKGADGHPQQRVNRSLVVVDLHNPTITR